MTTIKVSCVRFIAINALDNPNSSLVKFILFDFSPILTSPFTASLSAVASSMSIPT